MKTYLVVLFLIFIGIKKSNSQTVSIDTLNIKFNVKMLLMADNFWLSQWEKEEIVSYLNSPDHQDCIFLKSKGFKQFLFLQTTIKLNSFYPSDDSFNDKSKAYHLNHKPNTIFIIGINTTTGEMYRLSGFSHCDFNRLFMSNVKKHNYREDLKRLARKKSFLQYCDIENVDLNHLYKNELSEDIKRGMKRYR